MNFRIRRKGRALAIAASAAALTWACATATGEQVSDVPDGVRQCFLASQVRGFEPVDNDTVRVVVGVRRMYELQVIGSCPNMDWSRRIGIAATGGSAWVCRGMDAEVFVPSPIGVNRCLVRSVRQLTPEEVKATRRRS